MLLNDPTNSQGGLTDWEIVYASLRITDAPRELASAIASTATEEARMITEDEEDHSLFLRLRDWVDEDRPKAIERIQQVLDQHGVSMRELKGDGGWKCVELKKGKASPTDTLSKLMNRGRMP